MFIVGFMVGFVTAIAGAHGVALWVEGLQANTARNANRLKQFQTFKAQAPPLPSHDDSVPATWQE
tara:strand:+ start:625 stop:819 length:195 start_codon:yes stop_codon:yes gene_type:complete